MYEKVLRSVKDIKTSVTAIMKADQGKTSNVGGKYLTRKKTCFSSPLIDLSLSSVQKAFIVGLFSETGSLENKPRSPTIAEVPFQIVVITMFVTALLFIHN